MDLRKQCQQFAVDLLQQSRSSSELAIILNHDPDNPPYQEGEHMKLARLELAILYKQKKSMKSSVLEQYQKQRGNPPSILEYAVLIYVLGYIFEETHEIFTEGIQSYLRNLWNFIDFTRNLFYALTFVLRAVAYLQQINEIQKDPTTAFLRREQWHSFDPQLIAEGLFAAANIFR
ncbi:hypothetical protein YQE_01389, partial [Dendroctonus ponderosae]